MTHWCVFDDGEEAAARFFLNQGCVALRDTFTQDLCIQHIVGATPIDEMILVEDYTRDKVIERGLL